MTDDDLYLRGAATLVASWEAYASGSPGAVVRRLPGVAVGVFPAGPERDVYNNALLDRDLGPTARTDAVDAMVAAYAAAGVQRYAAWVHERDEALRTELERRGFMVEESTRAMAMTLDVAAPAALRGDVALRDASLGEHVALLGMPGGLLAGADASGFHGLAAEVDGEAVATGIAFDHDGDCGVFNVTTFARGTAARARYGADGAACGRRAVTRLHDREPAVDRDRAGRLRRGRLPRPRRLPRARALARPRARSRIVRRGRGGDGSHWTGSHGA